MLVTWQIHAIFLLGLFAIGTVVGSFLNVCIYRIPYEKSVIWPASHCPRCWSAIAPMDNIPILSWFATGNSSRRCERRTLRRADPQAGAVPPSGSEGSESGRCSKPVGVSDLLAPSQVRAAPHAFRLRRQINFADVFALPN